jgi:hypothetical protein
LRVTTWFILVLAAVSEATAQTRATEAFRPSGQLFARLFPANRTCDGCEERPGVAHLTLDSPRLTADWLSRHDYQSNGGPYGDNAAIADFWYDAVHRRLFTRSLVLHEVADPADLRLGRAPGVYPDRPDFNLQLEAGTTVGHVGFARWSHNGFGSYFAAVEGTVRDTGTGYLDLATVTGSSGVTRSGSRYSPEDLVKHVRLHPAGQLEVGFDTAVEARPDVALLVRGNTQIDGSLVVGGLPIVPAVPKPLACTVSTAKGQGRTALATCEAGQVATGGGGACASGELRGTRPVQTDGMPTAWEVTCSRGGAHDAYVICCAR